MKTGRKQKHYEAADGKTIVGLSKQPDGRWRIIGTSIRFSEPDEARAIEKFHRLTDDGLRLAGETPKKISKSEAIRVAAEVGISVDELAEVFEFSEKHFWTRVAREIRTRPKFVAQMTGIEQIGYLDQILPPAELPSFSEIETLWEQKSNVTPEQMRKVRRAWKDFKTTTEIITLRDITDEIAIAYADNVHSRKLGVAEQRHLFSNARRMLTFAKSRRIAIHEIEKALVSMRIMATDGEETTALPNPISVDDWQKLYKASEGRLRDRAMILVALNGGYYIGETVELEWSHMVGGCLIARRFKKGKHLRICVLWQETLHALQALPKIKKHIFTTKDRATLRPSGSHDAFEQLSERAKIKVTGAQLRDAATQTATEAGVDQRYINILMGWKNPGISDKYVLRNPAMVKPACDAIYAKYMM